MMAEELTATLNMRRPSDTSDEVRPTRRGPLHLEILEQSDILGTAPEVMTSLELGEPISVFSFREAVLAASVFYDIQEPGSPLVYGATILAREENSDPEKPAEPEATGNTAATTSQNADSTLSWTKYWMLTSGFFAILAIVVIYWGTSVEQGTIVFAGMLTFTLAIASWLVPFAAFSLAMFRDIKTFLARRRSKN